MKFLFNIPVPLGQYIDEIWTTSWKMKADFNQPEWDVDDQALYGSNKQTY
jgi:hypothetical protein